MSFYLIAELSLGRSNCYHVFLSALSTICRDRPRVQLYLQKHPGFGLPAAVSFKIHLFFRSHQLQAKSRLVSQPCSFSARQLKEHLGKSLCAKWVKLQRCGTNPCISQSCIALSSLCVYLTAPGLKPRTYGSNLHLLDE